MAKWRRLMHSQSGEVVWTDTPAAYCDDWQETERAHRRPGPHEDKVKGRWRTDQVALAKKQRRDRLKALHRDELVDHIVELVVAEVLERLKQKGLTDDGAA